MRGPADRKEETRRRLLASAARHFAEHGFDRASVDRISTEAGYAKGTIYNYFPSKGALFEAVLADACRRTVERYRAAGPGAGLRARLRALAAVDVEVLREQEPFMQVMIREAFSFRPQTWPLILGGLAPFVAAVEEILEDGRRRGALRRDRPVGELALLFAGQLGLLFVQHWAGGGHSPRLEEIPDLAVSLFLDGAGMGRRGGPVR